MYDDQRLRPSERLRRAREYQHVFQYGKKLVSPLFVVYILPSSESFSRLGMAVSKRVGKAVVRNRVKRLIRELFRRHKNFFKLPCDVVFVARHRAAEASLGDYTRQFLMLLSRYQQPKRDA
ncbi:MAG: ribonuclease P protein component [bacterium]|nr:ribonuclease P protein component [bacterium]